MKTLLIGAVASLLAMASVQAQSAVTTVTANGTLHQYVPGQTFVVTEPSGPVMYNYGPEVVYATPAGVVLTPEQVQAQIRVGVPVHVEYVPQGETRIIRRVVVDDDDDDDDDE